MKKYFIQTFGCQMNIADSEKLNMILLQAWLIKAKETEAADIVIFNTCSVRQKWEDRVFWYIEKIFKNTKKTKTQKPIIWITWCMVKKTWVNKKYLEKESKRNRAKTIELLENSKQIFNNDDKLFPRTDKIDFVFRIEEIKYLSLILSHIFSEHIWQDHKFDDYLKIKQLRENKAIWTTIIQTWCNNYCTYCIVPYTRWKEKSRNISEIVKEVTETVESWAKEIILVGQNVNSYWKNTLMTWWNHISPFLLKEEENQEISPFRELLNELDKIKWLNRLRFTSSNPHDMTKDILDSHFDLKSTCNYLHFALQSGNEEILKKMNRKHKYKDFKDMVFYLRNKDPLFSVSTDIIVWFSWETEKMFEDTIKAFKECEFDFAYNARYSIRKWTIASKLYPDDISDEIKAERWHILNDLLLDNIKKRNKLMLDKTEDVLIYWKKDSNFFGRTRNFKEIFFKWPENIKIWDIVKVKLLSLDRYVIKWEIEKCSFLPFVWKEGI